MAELYYPSNVIVLTLPHFLCDIEQWALCVLIELELQPSNLYFNFVILTRLS